MLSRTIIIAVVAGGALSNAACKDSKSTGGEEGLRKQLGT